MKLYERNKSASGKNELIHAYTGVCVCVCVQGDTKSGQQTIQPDVILMNLFYLH